MSETVKLISYIAPAAPATRRPAEGSEPFLRPEIGFTPTWYRQHLNVSFGKRFHCDPGYRRECVIKMRAELNRRFPGTKIGGVHRRDAPLDLLTGTWGASTVAALYGVPIVYEHDKWPNCEHRYLTDQQVARLEPPNLDRNPHFDGLMAQIDWIAAHEGRVEGFINWQGVLNNAHRLRGEQLFADMLEEPALARHLFSCVCETMVQGIRRLHVRQLASGVDNRFITISNCLVNLVSPKVYRELLLPMDERLASVYRSIGIHNCAWNATPYLEAYARLRGVGYIDMGFNSDLERAKALFPEARRALMYTPMDAINRTLVEIESDFRRLAQVYAPCDVVIADLEAGTPDKRVIDLIALCEQISKTAQR